MTQTVTAYDVRAQFEDLLERDLLGPWDGPTEELPPSSTPGERYLLGRLVPRRPDSYEPASSADSEDDDVEDRPELVEEPALDLTDDEDDEAAPAAAIRTRAMASSSLGLAFTVADDVDRVAVTASWGRYERGPSEMHVTETGRPRTVWKRVPAGGTVEIPTGGDDRGEAIPDPEQEAVKIRWRVRHRQGRRIVELFLVMASRSRRTCPTGPGCSRPRSRSPRLMARLRSSSATMTRPFPSWDSTRTTSNACWRCSIANSASTR